MSHISLVPAGTILPFGGATAPGGYLLCDGTSYVRTGLYAALFAAIGTVWGTADGTHFNAPDLQGRFLRGHDNAQGVDPDAAGRTACNTGGATGDAVGSVQAEDLKTHKHVLPYNYVGQPNGTAAVRGMVASGSTMTCMANTGGNETRPVNAGVNFIIKL